MIKKLTKFRLINAEHVQKFYVFAINELQCSNGLAQSNKHIEVVKFLQ